MNCARLFTVTLKDENMMKKLKEIFNIKRIVWFLLISGLFLVFYTPHLDFRVNLDSVSDGEIVLANYNTDRGEEIFENYNYAGHKTWYDVSSSTKEINIDNVPIVTDSLQMKLQNLQYMNIKDITINFGPFTLKKYTSETLTSQIAGSQGLDISFEDDLIHLNLEDQQGWIQFQVEEYMPKAYIMLTYVLVLLISWIVASLIVKHMSLIEKIPLNEIMLIAGPCWIFFMAENILGNIFYIALGMRLLNVGLMIVIYKIIWLILRRKPFAFNFTNLVFILYAIVSTFVVRFRNRPIAPWDFSAIGTAFDVAGNYNIEINYMMVIGLITCLILYIVMRAVPRDKTKINKWYVAYPAIIIAIAVFFNSIGSYYLWDIRLLNTFQNDGTALSFTGLVRQYIEDRPKEPEGYSISKLKKIEKKMEKDAEADVQEGVTTPVNIIQIMNESFSNLDVGGTNIAEGMTPYFDSLDNTIRGNLYVSVRGGGTCNTEYETLTGNTTSFFAAGVYPYNMYMNRDVPSTVSYMNQSGYTTTGIHLGKATNWNRRTAYKKLKFQDTVFAETFDGLDTIHGYPTDEQDFEKVEENYESNEGKNQFIFNVTYQNHGGYANTNDLKQTVDLSQYGTGYDAAENYLSLIKLSDDAYKNLIEYYSKVDEPTMIIMYGDHQPNLGAACDNLFFPYAGTPEQDMQEYITPFVIWANYDIPDQTIDKLSANYMSSLIMHVANLKKTPYQQFLWELKDEYPVISLYGCYDKDGRFYESVDDIKSSKINEYRMLQYNNVFDDNRLESLFWPKGKDTGK